MLSNLKWHVVMNNHKRPTLVVAAFIDHEDAVQCLPALQKGYHGKLSIIPSPHQNV